MSLIEEVKQRQCLWNKDDSEYLNYAFKGAAYEDISQIIDVPSEDIRARLRNLRTTFFQVYKKALIARRKSKRPPKWKFYKPMLYFADPSYATLPTSPLPEISETTKREESVECDDVSATIDPLENYENNNKQEQLSDFSDFRLANEIFGAYVAQSLNNLEECKIMKRTKARIKLILSEAMAERARSQLAECKGNGDF